MPWISACEIASLEHLFVPVVATYLANVALTDRGGSDDPQVRSYVHSFLLCTDKALRAYNLGRRLVVQYVGSANKTGLLFEACAEFETCITTTKRALLLASRMASHEQNPDIERDQRKLLAAYLTPVRTMRDAIEHMDDDIRNGGPQGAPAVLYVTQDSKTLQINDHTLPVSELTKCLEELHVLATALAARER